MSQNMYRVGDCVYFEDSNAGPYHIRRIEELSKNGAGNVEARVAVFYRRRDVSSALLRIADQAERHFDEYYEEGKTKAKSPGSSGVTNGSNDEGVEDAGSNGESVVKEEEQSKESREVEERNRVDWGCAGLPAGADKLTPEQRFRLRLKELFLSRQVETLPATQIRGKCSVTLLSEIETPDCYERDDSYFYSLVYDPVQMSLLADKGAIRVGEKYQADVPPFTAETKMEEDDNKENGDLMIADDQEEENEGRPSSSAAVVQETEREAIIYHPHHDLTEREIDQFLVIARSVGTFSRALDPSSSAKLPSLHMTAAAASRDVTVFHAMALLHQANYSLAEGLKFLVPPPSKQHYPLEVDKVTGHNTVSLGGPILIRDQIEEWSASEANLFEEALEKYGKDFSDIRNDFLPWKAMRDIVEYYYMWKTTNRYIDGRKKKSNEEKEAKLKQVYIPNHNKPSANLIGQYNTTSTPITKSTPCEGCKTLSSVNWYAWGPAALQFRLCQTCWINWKRSGGLPHKHECDRYDLEGGPEVAASDQKQPTATTLSNPMAINKTSAAAQNRVVSSGQVIARLPPNHPQFSSAPVASSATPTVAVAGGAQISEKPRAPFSLVSNLFTRVARRLAPKSVLNLKKQARRPGKEINANLMMACVQAADLLKLVEVAKTITNNRVPESFQKYLMRRVHAAQAQAKRPASSASAGEPPAKRQAPASLPTTRNSSSTACPPNVPMPTMGIPSTHRPMSATPQPVQAMGTPVQSAPLVGAQPVQAVGKPQTASQQNASKRGRLFCFVIGPTLRRSRSVIPRGKFRKAARLPFKDHSALLPL